MIFSRKYIIYYIIIVFSVIVIYLNNSKGQYLPMLIIMYFSPVLLFIEFKSISTNDILPTFLIVGLFSTFFTHPHEFRFSTVMYSSLFVSTYWYYTKLLPKSKFSYVHLKDLCFKIIKAYCIVMIVQQISSILHLPIINESYNVSGLKVNSLANEAAHIGNVLPILFFTYTKMREIEIGKRIDYIYLWNYERNIVYFFLYTMFSCTSVTCMISSLILISHYIPKKYLIYSFLVFLGIFFLLLISGVEVVQRIAYLVPAILTLDPIYLFVIDASSAARIGPYLLYIQEFNPADINIWLGYGCDYGGLHAYRFMSGVEVENNMGVGGLINFLYDYGLCAFIPFVVLIIRITRRNSFLFTLFILNYSTISFNMHSLWLFIILSFTINYFVKQYEKNRLLPSFK